VEWSQRVVKGAPAVLLLAIGLAFFNPTLTSHHASVLRPRADQMAHEWAEADRRTIEQQAARATANYAANRPEAPDLTALSLLKTIPYLPSFFERTKENEGQPFPERLALWKHRALLRVGEAHDAAMHAVLAKLAVQTSRESYVLFSIFTTCYEGRGSRHLGLVGLFVELAEEPCAPAGSG